MTVCEKAMDVRASQGKPGRDELESYRAEMGNAYALAISGKTASILVFRVAALNGLTM
jgi:hypothetical protein